MKLPHALAAAESAHEFLHAGRYRLRAIIALGADILFDFRGGDINDGALHLFDKGGEAGCEFGLRDMKGQGAHPDIQSNCRGRRQSGPTRSCQFVFLHRHTPSYRRARDVPSQGGLTRAASTGVSRRGASSSQDGGGANQFLFRQVWLEASARRNPVATKPP